MGGLGWYCPISPHISTHKRTLHLPPNFYILPDKILASPYCYLKRNIKVLKPKFSAKKWVSFSREFLKKCSACGAHFYKNLQFVNMKVCSRQKTLVPFTNILEIQPMIGCFCQTLTICKNSASYWNLVLTYCRFIIEHYILYLEESDVPDQTHLNGLNQINEFGNA